jgi:RNA recognition motif-containing protein
LDEWSIYVEGLAKPYDNEQKISELFKSLVGHVSFFRVPPNQQGVERFFGYCFIEFEYQEHVEKAISIINRYNRLSVGKENNLEVSQLKLIDKLNLRVISKYST